MSRSERLTLVDHGDPLVPVVTQCQLPKVARSTLIFPAGSGERGRSFCHAADG